MVELTDKPLKPGKTNHQGEGGGRPTKYKKGYNRLAFKFCLLGATDKELADFLDIQESTLNEWKNEYPKFSESLKRGKDKADAEVSEKLFQRAKGYSHKETKVFCNSGDIVTHDTVKHYPPDTAAAIIWLKNRRKQNWSDRYDHNLTGVSLADIAAEMGCKEG